MSNSEAKVVQFSSGKPGEKAEQMQVGPLRGSISKFVSKFGTVSITLEIDAAHLEPAELGELVMLQQLGNVQISLESA